MFSTVTIDAPFRVLVIDAAEDAEREVASRLVSVLDKREVALASGEPLAVTGVADLEGQASALGGASCVVLLGSEGEPAKRCLEVWEWLGAHVEGPKLAVVCVWGEPDRALTDAVLKDPPAWAPIGVAQESAVGHREGALFLMKFLTEAALHSEEQITGRMAWFAWRKADELLKRRRMQAKFTLRA